MADRRAARGADPSTQAVVDLLTSILGEVQKQVQSKAPPPLPEGAQLALDQFAEILAALALQPVPTIILTANPNRFGVNGGTTRLTWSSTQARRVSIDQNIGDVTPVPGGFIEVLVLGTTTFTATAHGPCGSATASVTVTVEIVQ